MARYDAYGNLVYMGSIGTNSSQVSAGNHTHDLGSLAGTLANDRFNAYSNLVYWLSIGTDSNQVSAGDHVHTDYEIRMDGIDTDISDLNFDIGVVSNMVGAETIRAMLAEQGLSNEIYALILSNDYEHSLFNIRLVNIENRTSDWEQVITDLSNHTNATGTNVHGLGTMSVIDDAPNDGGEYARKTNSWVAVVGATNASEIAVAFTPTNYTSASADVEEHFIGVDAKLVELSITNSGYVGRATITGEYTTVEYSATLTGTNYAVNVNPVGLAWTNIGGLVQAIVVDDSTNDFTFGVKSGADGWVTNVYEVYWHVQLDAQGLKGVQGDAGEGGDVATWSQYPATQVVTNHFGLYMTNDTFFNAGQYGDTNGVYWTYNGTNYWILFE